MSWQSREMRLRMAVRLRIPERGRAAARIRMAACPRRAMHSPVAAHGGVPSRILLTACVLLLALALWSAPAHAAPGGEPFKPQYEPTLEVREAPGEIRIDGELDDPGWKDAARARGFAETSPGDQIEPPCDSECWITYDEENLYVALIAGDDPKSVRVSMRERDDIWQDDYFGLMLDTYGDHNWGYEFFVNPLGIQGDLRMYAGGNEDISYDCIWHSRGRMTERGYQVEMAIPFASLRFPHKDEHAWRINFWRDQQREVRRQMAWAATNRDEPCWMCQWGTITGIRGIRPPRNLELIASAIGTQAAHARGDEASGEYKLDYADPQGEAALNLRYALSSTSTTELAVNPDFSQIESDAGQIDINEPFTIFYEEKRPFFLEGLELYRTDLQVVYSRSISDPAVAGKLLGSRGRTSFAWTVAQDENSPVILPLEERSFFRTAGDSWVNLARVQQAFGEDSHVGWILTDRRFDGGGSGTVTGADGAVRFLRNFEFSTQAVINRVHEPDDSTITFGLPPLTFDDGKHTLAFDGEQLTGHAIYASIEREGRVWNGDLEYDERHPSFRADNGFISRTDYRSINAWNGLTFQPNGKTVVSWQPSLVLGRMWDYSGRFQDEWAMLAMESEFKRQTRLEVEGLLSRERFREKIIPGIRRMTIGASTRPSELIGIEADLEFGRSIYRTFNPEIEPFLGRMIELEVTANLKLLSRLTLTTSYSYERMKDRAGERVMYDGWILRNRANLQINREASLRLVTEYDSFDERFAFEPLLTYRLNAFSVFYLGMSDQYLRMREYQRASGDEPPAPDGDKRWDIDGRQIFAKIQYLLRV